MGVFGLALALRLVHIWQISRAPFFGLKLGDAAAYDAWAQRILAGDWAGREVFYQAPLYPYVLAVVYGIFGSSPVTIRVVQAVLSAASCALLADAGWRLFSRRSGIVAGVLMALYPPAIFLDTLLQKSVLDTFFLCLTIWLVARLAVDASRRHWFPLGAAMGALWLTRENAAVLVAPVLLWIVVRGSVSRRARAVEAALFLAGIAAVLGPVAIRNRVVGGEWFITTSQFGPNLYIGNNEASDGAYRPLRPFRQKPAFERQDATELAEQAAGRPLTPGEVSAYYTRRVLDFVRSHPGRWARLLGRKFVLTWNATEISDTEDQYTYAHWSWPLALGAVWHLGVLAPLAVIGFWITAADRRRLWVLYLMLAAYTASVVLFYVFARYRFPIVPFLTLFAAAGIVGVRAHVRAHGASGLVPLGVGAAAVAVFCNLPVVPRAKLEAATHFNFGVGLEAAGHDDEAAAEYRGAVALDPTLAPAHDDLALLLARRNQLSESAAEFQQAVRYSPDRAVIHDNFAVVLARQGRLAEAADELEQAVRLDPSYGEARGNLVAIRSQLAGNLARQGRFDLAEQELRRASAVSPDRADLHNNLGIALARQGRLREATAEFERALALKPGDAQTERNLERVRRR